MPPKRNSSKLVSSAGKRPTSLPTSLPPEVWRIVAEQASTVQRLRGGFGGSSLGPLGFFNCILKLT